MNAFHGAAIVFLVAAVCLGLLGLNVWTEAGRMYEYALSPGTGPDGVVFALGKIPAMRESAKFYWLVGGVALFGAAVLAGLAEIISRLKEKKGSS